MNEEIKKINITLNDCFAKLEQINQKEKNSLTIQKTIKHLKKFRKKLEN
jgi:hypothetical protein